MHDEPSEDLPVPDSGVDAEPSLAEQAVEVERDLSSAIAHVLNSLDGGAVPYAAAPATALILLGARCLRDLGWPEERALATVAEAFTGDRDAHGLDRPRPN